MNPQTQTRIIVLIGNNIEAKANLIRILTRGKESAHVDRYDYDSKKRTIGIISLRKLQKL